MFGKGFPVTANFSSDICELNFGFKYLLVEVSLSIIFGKCFPQIFFGRGFFLKIVLWRFLFREFLVEMFLPILFW